MRLAHARTLGLSTAIALAGALGVAGLAGAPPAAAELAFGCTAGATHDYDGDGYADMAVGDPTATVDGMRKAGAVTVYYGDASGQIAAGGAATYGRGEFIGGTTAAGDQFGFSLASADLDCDGFTDLVVGAPYDDVGGVKNAGSVLVLWGAAGGLDFVATEYTAQFFGRTPQQADYFGFAVDAMEDIGQGGTPAPDGYALAIGVPGRDSNGVTNAGAVAVRTPVDGGNVDYWFTPDSPGVAGASETGDKFGTSLALGYLAGDSGLVDLAVGTPYEDIGSRKNAGDVTLLIDLYDGVTSSTRLDQAVPGVATGVEAGDWFGYSLDAAPMGSRWRLVVGVPKENIGSDADAGVVHVFTTSGSSLRHTVSLSQDTAGVGGATETGDKFGHTVAWVPPTAAEPRSRVAIGVPGEDLGSVANAGMVQVIPIFAPAADISLTQSTAGVPGANEKGDKFGLAIAVITEPVEQALFVGVPDDANYARGMVAVIPLDGGSPRGLFPMGTDASRLGASLTGEGF